MNLDDLRKRIDELDESLLRILNERLEVVHAVGELKRKEKSVIYRPEREKSIIDRLDQLNTGEINRAAIEAIYMEIFAISRNYEMPEKISFLGPEGSFTHQVAEQRFGALSTYISLPTIRSVFESVDTNRVRFGVIPVENNQEGTVAETIEQIIAKDIKIVAEITTPIHFSLVSQQENTQQITKIYSKDIAFRQCKNFLSDYFGDDIPKVSVTSTSRAAELAAAEPTSAAICSHIAGKMYDVPVLFDNIEDSAKNTTRFLIVAKDFLNQKGDKDKTTVLAKAGHHPGALLELIQKFSNYGINLTKLESRPAPEESKFNYWFIIDFDGHYSDEPIQKILEDHADQIQLLGSYPKIV